MLGLMKLVSSVQKSFRWDAANIEAGTSKSSSFLDTNGLEASLTSLDCCNIATWATTDDSDVVLSHGKGHARELHEAEWVSASLIKSSFS